MTARASLVLPVFLLAAASLTAQERRGAFALHYGPPLTATELEWYGRFDILVTHDCLPADQVRALRRGGTKLFFYEWSVAFYATRAGEWEKSLIGTRSPALLNHTGLRGGVGASDIDAFYFDPTDKEARDMRATLLRERLVSCGYDGVFFDTIRFESVHPDAKAEYSRRHPGQAFDTAFALFLRVLKQRLGERMIFTNQGFRDARNYLPFANWDLSESFVTYPCDGRFIVRPWNDPNDPWNSIRFILQQLSEPATRRYTRSRAAHLNYIDAPDRDVIHLVVATSHLFGAAGYVAGPTVLDEQDNIYFWDPGKPLGPRIDAKNASYRRFENGVVVVNGGPREFVLPSRGVTYENLTTGEITTTLRVPAGRRPTGHLFRILRSGRSGSLPLRSAE